MKTFETLANNGIKITVKDWEKFSHENSDLATQVIFHSVLIVNGKAVKLV